MKRLYVGGLGHSVTDKDLRDRFGKFGKVEDVELKTRTDDQGLPFKTFGYINIVISDSDLKKCQSVLNKSQWKGGTLQIETAKESFLQRLCEERAERTRLALSPPGPSSQQKILDSLKDAGVSNFTMKSAVPGTEIPGHKEWVVGKFGRVLPVLQLKHRHGDKVKTLKYDPSKYGHNLRVLAQPPGPELTPTPVSHLTWAIEGGDDDMSRKRRGEFPPFTKKRSRKEEERPSLDLISSCNGSSRPIRALRPPLDSESEEELLRLQNNSHNSLGPEDDTLEVVSLDYTRKADDGDSADTDELFSSRKPQMNKSKMAPEKKRKNQNGRCSKYDSTDDEEDKDSGKKPLRKVKKAAKMADVKSNDKGREGGKERREETIQEPKGRGEETDQGEEERIEETNRGGKERKKETNQGDKERREETEQERLKNKAETDLGEEQGTDKTNQGGKQRREEMKQGSKKRKEEADQEAMERIEETNKECKERTGEIKQGAKGRKEKTRQGDKERKEETDQGGKRRTEETDEGDEERTEETDGDEESTEETDGDEEGDCERSDESDDDYDCFFSNVTQLEMSLSELQSLAEKYAPETPTPTILSVDYNSSSHTPKKGTTPEEILASLLEGDSSNEEEEEEEERKGRKSKQKKRSVAMMSLPAFRGTAALEEEEEEKKNGGETEEEEEEKSSSDEESDDDSSDSSSEDQEESQPLRACIHPPRVNQRRPEEEAELQRRANERRLAAVNQRQKETEQNRKLLQGALSNLDGTPGGSGGKHIVFGSDDEDKEDEERQEETPQLSANQIKASSAPRLFDSDDDDDEEEQREEQRFEIRPEFEGAAGQKLMALQSRFGTDERFRMDARFLDDEAEEKEESERAPALSERDQEGALLQEKEKNLSILQSILGSSAAPDRPAGGSRAKTQTFRDVSALHYDPSKEEHAAFEKKLDETKESKASRRKKREEAHKLPEVSREMYFEVNTDLKSVFGKETENQEKEENEEKNWDQKEGGDEEGGDKEGGDKAQGDGERGDEGGEEETSGGFKFSFFGDEPEPQPQQTEYKVQNILAPKLSWQQDSRLNDSSDEEEEVEQEEDGGDTGEEEEKEEEKRRSTTAKKTEEEMASGLFFFFSDDRRLTDGPRWFCRTSLDEQRETWDQTRTELRQDCKKKHKDARRRLRLRR